MKITLGSDPELMLMDRNAGKIVNALDVIGRDKNDPVKLDCGEKYYADNALFEFSVKPADTTLGMVQNLQQVIREAAFRLPEHRLVAQSSHVFDNDDLKNPASWLIGCTPSFNAWTEQVNQPSKFDSGLRTGSFHIHIGMDNLKKLNEKLLAVRMLDIHLGCASVLFDNDPSVKARRQLYGKAGEFRPTPYGIEYRVLGNWALGNKELTTFIFDFVGWILLESKDTAQKIVKEINREDVFRAINECDAASAVRVLKSVRLPDRIMDTISKNYSHDFNAAWGVK